MDALELQWQLPGRLVAAGMRRLLPTRWSPLATLAALATLVSACVADDPTAATFVAQSTLPPVTEAATTAPPAGETEAEVESEVEPESTTTTGSSTTEPLPPLQGLDVELLADGFDQPVTVATGPAGASIFVAEREGVIKVVDPATGQVAVHADLTDRIGSSSIEQGLLGLAFDGNDLYAYWTDPQGDSVLARFPNGAEILDLDSQQVLLTVDQPAERHNAGHIVIDGGYLYLSLGDGGSGGGPAQDTSNLLGAILRLDLDGNPVAGNHEGRIWVYGLRNPWRFSIDDGFMYIGDVGQEQYEEINVIPVESGAGSNFGWIQMEGDSCFRSGCNPTDFTLPVLQYSHDEGCSITGGHVYRGSAIPEFEGHYFYADWCRGWVRSMRYDTAGGTVTDQFDWSDDLAPLGQVTSFGVDGGGELLTVDWDGRLHRIIAKR